MTYLVTAILWLGIGLAAGGGVGLAVRSSVKSRR